MVMINQGFKMRGLDGHLTIPGWTNLPSSGMGRKIMSHALKGMTDISRAWKSGKDFIALGSSRDLQSNLSHDG